MAKVHIVMRIEKLNQSLTSISSSSDQGNASWNIIRLILFAKRRIRVGCRDVSKAPCCCEASGIDGVKTETLTEAALAWARIRTSAFGD